MVDSLVLSFDLMISSLQDKGSLSKVGTSPVRTVLCPVCPDPKPDSSHGAPDTTEEQSSRGPMVIRQVPTIYYR